MDVRTLADALFPDGHDIAVDGALVHGTARTAVADSIVVLGTAGGAAVDHNIALGIAGRILQALAGPRQPLVFLVDTSGQALRRHEELLGLNAYLAHLAACVDLARRSGFPSLSIVYGEAVSGGYLSLGLMADRAYALAEAQIRVMDLKAMARVTRIPHEELLRLARESPVFAPGAANYVRMGALREIWPEPSAQRLNDALGELLREHDLHDERMAAGYRRGGRMLAQPTAMSVARAA